MASEVIEFIRTEVQNHRDKTEHWFCTFFTDKQLRIYKTRIHDFQVLVISGLMPFSATPNLNFPPFLVKYITNHHANVILKWTDRIDNNKLHFSHEHNFGHANGFHKKKLKLDK